MATVNVITKYTGQQGYGIAIGGQDNIGCTNAASAGCNGVALVSGASADRECIAVGRGANAKILGGGTSGGIAIGWSAQSKINGVAIGSGSSCGYIAPDGCSVIANCVAIGPGAGASMDNGCVALGANVTGHASSARNGIFIGGSSISFYIGGQRKTLSATDFFAKLS